MGPRPAGLGIAPSFLGSAGRQKDGFTGMGGGVRTTWLTGQQDRSELDSAFAARLVLMLAFSIPLIEAVLGMLLWFWRGV
jgi:hypothetical protein